MSLPPLRFPEAARLVGGALVGLAARLVYAALLVVLVVWAVRWVLWGGR